MRYLLKGKDPPDALNVGQMVNGILVASVAPQYLALAADHSRLTTTHAAVIEGHNIAMSNMQDQLRHAQTSEQDAQTKLKRAQKSEQKAQDELVFLKAKLADTERCSQEYLRDSQSYRDQVTVANEARS